MIEILAAAGSLLGAVATFSLLFFVVKQWRGDALHRLHEKLIEADAQEALRIVFAAKPAEFLDRDDLRLRDATEKVLNLYDLIGKRVEAGTIPKESVLESEWPTILRVAQQLGDYIDQEAAARGTPYKSGFRWLVTEIKRNDAISAKVSRLNPGRPKHPWTGLPTISVVGLRGYRNSHPAVAVFIVWDNKVLLLKRTRPPLGWEMPGGFLDDGEHPVACVEREVKEETRFALTSIRLIDVQTGDYGPFNTLDLCYRADLQPTCSSTPTLDPKESSDYRWYPLGQGKLRLQADFDLAFPWVGDPYEML